eukprot:1138302-Pelagomonas_calceolata.AAC.6
MVPADGNFTTSIQKGDHKAGEVQGQTRQHARLINLLGVKQLVVGVNKMDCDTAGYKVGEGPCRVCCMGTAWRGHVRPSLNALAKPGACTSCPPEHCAAQFKEEQPHCSTAVLT